MQDSIGPYQLLEELARGGMGVVYRAQGPQGPCAVKLLLEGTVDPRFERELEAQRRLVHPGIVRVLDGGRGPRGRQFMVMELVKGGSLADRLRREGALPAEEVMPLALQLCDALSFAHEHDVLHRDLKPGNVMLDAEGRVKLTDFGLAKIVDQRESLTRTGVVMGTPSYMPPEQAAGEREQIGPRSDVYGLGATLYDLLCDRPPFEGKTALNLIVAVINNPPDPPSRHCLGLDPRLDRILLRCLAKDPDDRYASVAELRSELAGLTRSSSRRLPAAAVPLAIVACGVLAAGMVVISARKTAPVSPVAAASQSPAPTDASVPTTTGPALDPASRELAESTLRSLQDMQHRVFSGEVRHGSREESQLLTQAWNACQRAPNIGPWLVAKAHLDIRGDEPENAVEKLKRATEQEPERAYTWTKLGQAHMLTDPDAPSAEQRPAREALERALELDPDQTLALYVLAKIDWNTAPDTALSRIDRALLLQPRWWILLEHRSRILSAMDNLSGALADCDRALAISPGRVDLLLQRGQTRLDVGDMAGAEADLAQAESVGATVDSLVLHGRMLISAGKEEQALVALEQALELDPSDPRARVNHAGLLSQMGNPKAALEELEAVLADPRVRGNWRVKAHIQHAGQLAQTGRPEEALTELSQAEAMPEAILYREFFERFRSQIEGVR